MKVVCQVQVTLGCKYYWTKGEERLEVANKEELEWE